MSRRFLFLFFCLGAASLAFGGCALPGKIRRALVERESQDLRLERYYLAQALGYERQGQPERALQAYEAALTVVLARKQALEQKLRRAAERHYRQGLQLRDQGKYGDARHEFLVALRLWPSYPEVVRLLQPAERPRPSHYLVHEVEAGEYLSEIAETYYNDPSKFHIIARFNDLEDATTIHPGMKLKVPEIEGLPFPEPEEKQPPPEDYAARGAGRERMAPGAAGAVKVEDAGAEEVDPETLASYEEQGMSLFQEGKYLASLNEFQKVLNLDPDRKQTRWYMSQAHFRLGADLFRKSRYLEARLHFLKAVRLDERCASCREQLDRCEYLYKETHYRKGMECFEQEDLKGAIKEWCLVQELDADYKQVRDYLQRARNLLEKVQHLKESPPP